MWDARMTVWIDRRRAERREIKRRDVVFFRSAPVRAIWQFGGDLVDDHLRALAGIDAATDDGVVYLALDRYFFFFGRAYG